MNDPVRLIRSVATIRHRRISILDVEQSHANSVMTVTVIVTVTACPPKFIRRRVTGHFFRETLY